MQNKTKIVIGIIGGTGIDQDPHLLIDKSLVKLEPTPYGVASDSHAIHGLIDDTPVYVISRHGKKHDIDPSHVNYRANLWTLVEQLGCTHIIATSACGSLQKNIHPGTIGILDSYFDRTHCRERSFYKVIHVEQKNPISKTMQSIIEESCREEMFQYNPNLISVCIEGPQFSTMPESKFYQSLGFHTVNMTTVPEVPLACQLDVFYGCILLVTDYDCWNVEEDSVNATLVVDRMKELGAKARKLIPNIIRRIRNHDWTQETKERRERLELSIMAK